MQSRTKSNLGVGDLLRIWRERRDMSQLALAAEADISQRHLSYVENGRASPSRAMVLRLAQTLDVPLRERNALLLSAGYAPLYKDRCLESPKFSKALKGIRRMLAAHEPYPALVIDRHWNLVDANRAVFALLQDCDPELLEPPVNVVRISLHARGLAPRIANLEEWRDHLVSRLERQRRQQLDTRIEELLAEICTLAPDPPPERDAVALKNFEEVAAPLRLRMPFGEVSFLSCVLTFGTAVDVTLPELSLELFFPENSQTAAMLSPP